MRGSNDGHRGLRFTDEVGIMTVYQAFIIIGEVGRGADRLPEALEDLRGAVLLAFALFYLIHVCAECGSPAVRIFTALMFNDITESP